MDTVHGILNVHKPLGYTSMDVLRWIKPRSQQKKVGHGGTLDPKAEGVLPICFGQATRMMEYLIHGVRNYRAEIQLGITTDTYDAEGQVTKQGDYSKVTRSIMEEALSKFRGSFLQVPPIYSALKQDGQRLYNLARAGVQVSPKPRQVEIFRLELLEFTPPFMLVEVECGRGVYIRSLAYDVGEVLGCGAHLGGLVRLSSGPFHVSEALSLQELELHFSQGTWVELLHSMDFVLLELRAAIVGEQVAKLLRQGRPLNLGPVRSPQVMEEQCRIYSTNGEFLGVARFDRLHGCWQPQTVFA